MNKTNISQLSCADCAVQNCHLMNTEYPAFCPTPDMDNELFSEAIAAYDEGENKRIFQAAAEVETEHYCMASRAEEIIYFAKKIGAKKIGIATCVGLLNEAGIFTRILRSHGFEVTAIGCKAGAYPKEKLGIDKKCEATGRNMCNPILQAKYLNAEKTDLNVVIGLCVGHDSLFYKYSDAYATTLIVKDRVTGHNPAAALYNANSYYKKKFSLEEMD